MIENIIAAVSKLEVKEGDVIVYKTTGPISHEAMKSINFVINEKILGFLGLKGKVLTLVLEDGNDLQILRKVDG